MSDDFLGMSIEAQLFYVLLLFDADVCGRIFGAGRICRGFGFDGSILTELHDNGFLLRVDGVTVDRYCWLNNKYDKRFEARMDSWEAFTSGRIRFAGKPFKSPYVLNVAATTEERRNNDAATTQNTTQCNGNSNPTESQPQQQQQWQYNVPQGDNFPAQQGEELHPCVCVKCRSTSAHYFTRDAATFITCDSCGTYEYQNRQGF